MVKEKAFKQTEIGLVPQDWEVINLETNYSLKARIGWQGLTTAEYLASGDYGLVTGTDFKNGYIDWQNSVFVAKERYIQDANIQLRVDDVLVTKDGTIGKVAYINELPKPTTLNSGVFVLRPKSKCINNRFFYYVLMSFYFDDFLAKITAGSTITHLYQKDFVHFNFILPHLTEQQAIAEALSDADVWIESLENLVAKKRLLKQGAMQELLTPKEGWEMKKLGNCSFITKLAGFEYSLHFNSYKNKGEIIVVRGTNITNNKLDLSDIKTIPTKTSNYLIRSKLFKNDLVFAYVGTIGPIYLIEENDRFHLGPNTAKITVNKDLDSKFLYHYFTSSFIKNEIIEHTTIGAQPSLSMSKIRSFKLNFPSLTEQTRIATILSDMDTEIANLDGQMAKARQLKQGMMQELLTGRVRLV